MKISILLIFISVFNLLAEPSYSQSEKVSLKLANVNTIENVISEIEKTTDYVFIYNEDVISTLRNEVDVEVTNQSLDEVLNLLLEGTDLAYSLSSKQVTLYKDESKGVYAQITSAAPLAVQQPFGKTITGRVTDTYQDPLPGVTVVVKGTTKGTTTDVDGNFSVTDVPESATLQFSFVGMETLEFVVGTQNTINVNMKEDAIGLEEIVAIGYGTVRKRDLTGAVGSISSDKIALTPATNVVETMQGRIPGVLINMSSTHPGSNPSVIIRGKRSISGGSDPLYVVDGVSITGGLSEINPLDVESIDVLKDASATAIYGARGSNGVVLITTKKGRKGRTTVDYSGYAGVQTVLNELEYMDGGEFTEYVRESFRATNKYPSDVPSWELDQNIPAFKIDPYTLESIRMGYDDSGNYDPAKVRSDSKWWEEVQRTGFITNHQVSIRGGNEKTLFNFSASYFNEKGLMKDEEYARFSVRSNIEHEVNDWLKIGANSQFARSQRDRGSSLYNAWRVIPIGRLYDEDGEVLPMVAGQDDQQWNPITRLMPGAVVNPYKVNNFMGSYFAEIKLPVDGLRLRSNVGLSQIAVQDYDFRAAITRGKTTRNSARNATGNRFSYLWENLIYYDKKIEDHNFGAMFLQSIQEYTDESNNIPVEDTPSDMLLYYDVGSASAPGLIGSNKQQWNLASFMSRVNYTYKGRYLLTASIRYDGSSRLAADHQWVMFPAASFAWRINEENFIRNIQSLSNFKLRVGYGTTASSEVSPYETKGTLQQMYYSFGEENKMIGHAPNRMPNSTLTWEKTGQWNAGIDFGFFNNRINGVIDFYLQNTKNLLLNRQLPVVSGFDEIRSNIGRTRNKGVELSLNTVNIDNKNFGWTTDFMLYSNKEEIIELYSGKVNDPGNSWFIGEAIDVFYDYKKVGIWQDTPDDREEMAKFNAQGSNYKPGYIRLWDDGDYKITPEDRVIQGKARPSIVLSLNNSMSYKKFDLSFYFLMHEGAMLNSSLSLLNQSMRNGNVKVDYWTPTNPTNAAPRPIEGVDFLDYSYTLNYQKADFVKLKNVTLGYTIPSKQLERFSLSNLRLYVQALNPWMWTNYDGVDPEGGTGYTRPTPSTWLVGLNISF